MPRIFEFTPESWDLYRRLDVTKVWSHRSLAEYEAHADQLVADCTANGEPVTRLLISLDDVIAFTRWCMSNLLLPDQNAFFTWLDFSKGVQDGDRSHQTKQ